MNPGRILILGAGPTGLGAARALTEAGHRDWLLLEAAERPGGLSASFRDEAGFTWDLGGHVIFSHYGRFNRLLEECTPPGGWLSHDRVSYIRLGEAWVPYPFQNNLHRLPPALAERCLSGLREAPRQAPPGGWPDFRAFILGAFGQGIAESFMLPYNRKVWGAPAEEMSAAWIGDRVALPDPEDAARSLATGRDRAGWGPNNRFRFPRQGGTGALWEAVAARLPAENLRLGARVTGIDLDRRRVSLAGGEEQAYDRCLSTLPLDLLAKLSGEAELIEAARELRHTSILVVGVGLRGSPPPRMANVCWLYSPEPEVPFYRVTHLSHYSPENVPDIARQWSLMAEVTLEPETPDKAAMAAQVVDSLARLGLIAGPEQVSRLWTREVAHAYPVPTRGRDASLARLQPALIARGVYSRGRFGSWLYEVGNMDHSYMQGWEAAMHLVFGAPEVTLWHPEVVNHPHPVLGWDLFR
ncbi:MAG: FAD-dependent oxidoreductase [Deltaproteobacteria bacterium]|nr:FAD-dependent oxidoreductase [Deltaproteobacteria bacterium]